MPDSFVYLALLLGWALPVIALQWIVGAPELIARWRLLVVAVGAPAVYLTLADAVAIGSGVWTISEELTIGVRAGSLVLEEALFFLLTNMLVAQSIVLFFSPSARARAERIGRAILDRVRRRDPTDRRDAAPAEPLSPNDPAR